MVEGRVYRLMGLLNFRVDELGEYVLASSAGISLKGSDVKIIHWLPLDGCVGAKVIMPDVSEKVGLCDSACNFLDVDSVIQFVRFGFVRLDALGDPLVFYYAHP